MTYLGNKGYTIPKDCLDISEQVFIRKTLLVKPYIPKSTVQPKGFPVYRESNNKLYIPRYFGNTHYGLPENVKLTNNVNHELEFKGELRDYQKHIVKTYLSHTNDENGGGGLLEIPCGRGKTIIALNIISKLKTRTLVVVHKSFLLNQWIERIEQFLPEAKIGRIQGNIIDIEGKDIVIGMLQSLSMKEYPENMFETIGLTIVDECHHISSDVFSRSLLKIVTKYTLGLSATMQRKDGLTHVFKMFLGEIVYSEEREKDDNVLVKGIEYKVDDKEFNEIILDYKGKPMYSSMITKICNYNRRNDFIIQVIIQELKEKEDQQIMILSQNKSILTYLFESINHKDIAKVGYYVGGMKEVELKKSEECKIILATYSMAAEALDIKSLTTLILSTPRTDITQAVGRILRVKHERPMVVDIIDTHDVFKNQWKKRKTFYRKNNYTLKETNSKDYLNNIWKTKEDKKVKKCLFDVS